jgi:hypothetical protein
MAKTLLSRISTISHRLCKKKQTKQTKKREEKDPKGENKIRRAELLRLLR